MSYIILDLDNCISDDAWRVPKIRFDVSDLNQRYHDYHMLSSFDAERNTHLTIGHDVIISTSRPQYYESITRCWLYKHGIAPAMLFMRKDYDHRQARILKREHYDAMMGANLNGLWPFCAYDDSPEVIAMYRDMNVNAKQICINDADQYERWKDEVSSRHSV